MRSILSKTRGSKSRLTYVFGFVKHDKTGVFLERYRSGHNEAVLKTVCPQGHVGSNPTLSVGGTSKDVSP